MILTATTCPLKMWFFVLTHYIWQHVLLMVLYCLCVKCITFQWLNTCLSNVMTETHFTYTFWQHVHMKEASNVNLPIIILSSEELVWFHSVCLKPSVSMKSGAAERRESQSVCLNMLVHADATLCLGFEVTRVLKYDLMPKHNTRNHTALKNYFSVLYLDALYFGW